MSIGTVYYIPRSSRYEAILALAKYLKLDIDFVDTAAAPEFAELFPLRKVPAFVGSDGYEVSEMLAIANYLIRAYGSDKIQEELLGKTAKDTTEIIKWCSLTNTDLSIELIKVLFPLLGRVPYNKDSVKAAEDKVDLIAYIFDARLKNHDYLATGIVTLADIVAFTKWKGAFGLICDGAFRSYHPYLVKWFNHVKNSEFFKMDYGSFEPIENKLEPPK